MKTIDCRFDLCALHYSQSLVRQGFSHHLPITQTSYTLLQTYTFVQHSTQPCNRYSYALNNPLRYRDPDGEFIPILIPIVIGVLAGGYAGYQIGKAEGASGWEMAGYIISGAAIGGIAGWAGGAVGGAIAGANFAGASAVGAIVGGATSGAISGGGFAALGGRDIEEGMWKGAVAGAAGGFVGGAIGGSAGAFFGGATAGYVGARLYGATNKESINAAFLSGAISLGFYGISTYVNYLNYEGNLNFMGYARLQGIVQRSNFWEAEAAWYETTNGNIKGVKYGLPFESGVNPSEEIPLNVAYESHTHVRYDEGYEWYGPKDIINYQVKYNWYGYKVYGWNNVYTLSMDKLATLPVPPIDISIPAYGIWSADNGINIGISHGLNLYNQIFWLWR